MPSAVSCGTIRRMSDEPRKPPAQDSPLSGAAIPLPIPLVVTQALALAERLGFDHSCTPEVGRLLATLAATVAHGTVAEIGTGYGVGTAWIASTLRPEVALVTVEVDEDRADAARQLLVPYPNVRVLHADWHALLPEGPFALLFADGGRVKYHEPEATLVRAALAVGGMLVLDDLTPVGQWPAAWRGKPDPVRERWLQDPGLSALELQVSPTHCVILATRTAGSP